MENSKENVLKFLKNKKAIPNGCENNEYWNYWREMLLEYGNTVLQQADVSSQVCEHPYHLTDVMVNGKTRWCYKCNSHF